MLVAPEKHLPNVDGSGARHETSQWRIGVQALIYLSWSFALCTLLGVAMVHLIYEAATICNTSLVPGALCQVPGTAAPLAAPGVTLDINIMTNSRKI